nr:5976_t:CDS:2 [Entrophospora candida]
MSNLQEVKIVYFATARDATNLSSETISLNSNNDKNSITTLQEIINILKSRHKNLTPILENCMFAINMEYVDNVDKSMIKSGDEVAIIPPVSGG